GIHLDTALSQEFRDVLVRQRIPQIPADAQQDHLARKMAPFEGIGRSDRHQVSTLPDEPGVFARESSAWHRGSDTSILVPGWAFSGIRWRRPSTSFQAD